MNYHINRVDAVSTLPGFVRRLSWGALCVMSLLFAVTPAFAKNVSTACGSLVNGFGPFDYRDPAHQVLQPGEVETKLGIVERAHFTREVETLVSGLRGRKDPLDDLDYTLRAFPNHHRALSSMANYHIKNDKQKIGRYSIDCWFQRATVFTPDDPVVRVVYAIYLVRTGKSDEALVQYKEALALQPNYAEAHYNVGLLYTKNGNYDLAYEHAERAYELGHPLPGLRNRLIAAGAWNPQTEEE